jgi:hypothetical protein
LYLQHRVPAGSGGAVRGQVRCTWNSQTAALDQQGSSACMGGSQMGERDKARPPKIHASLAEKRRRPEAVLEHIGEGDDVIVGMHNSEPATVLNAMEANADRSFGVRAHQMFPAASVVTCTGSSPGSATSPGSSRRPSGRLFARGPATWYPTTHREREHHGHAQAHPPEQGRRDQHPGRGRLYEFVRENPGVEYWPVDQTNNERAIAGEKSFVAVNATMEVDFPGQCASESLGGPTGPLLGGNRISRAGPCSPRTANPLSCCTRPPPTSRSPASRRSSIRGGRHHLQEHRGPRDDRVRRGRAAREQHKGTGAQAHSRSPPEFPRGVEAEGEGDQLPLIPHTGRKQH